MLDEIFFKERLDTRPVNFLFFGFLMTLLGIFSGVLIFGIDSSVAQILLVTILLMPVGMRLFRKAELRDARGGARKIYKNHKDVLHIFIMLFLGVFIAYFIVQVLTINNVGLFREMFDFQVDYLVMNEHLTKGLMDSLGGEGLGLFGIMKSLLFMTALLVIVCFILSIFYGSGGLFLLVLSASIFSTLGVFMMRMFEFFLEYSLAALSMFILIYLPIMFAFILSATAGGIISKAVVSKNIRTKSFARVVHDGLILFAISLLVLIVGVSAGMGLFALLIP